MLRTRAIYMLIILIFILPGLVSPVSGRGSLRTAYSPSFSMPLPTPPGGLIVEPAPVSGILKVLVIAAYFSDVNYTVSIGQLKQSFFSGLEKYYGEISYGKVTVEGDAYGWYKLPYPQSHYGKNCLSINDADCSGQDNSWEIAQDVVGQAEKDVNFANYNYFVFIHSGDGQESSGVTDEVWSVTYMGGVSVETTTRTLFQFSIVSELEAGGADPLGVWCHEFAHLLNIPDLFNTNTGQPILGPWSLMDKGTWDGTPPGSSPAHLIAWGKIQLGFISGSMLATANPGVTSTFTIDPTEVATNNVHVVEVPLGTSDTPSEYYTIEVRASIGFDTALPNFGVLISLVNNNAVVGPIHIIDGHPSVPGLNDAVWDVGQTFTDTANGLSISITGKVGNSYQVTVNRGGSQQPPPPQQPQNQTYIDLAITSISAQPATITLPNTTVTITVQISNSGNEAANNVPIEVNLDSKLYTNLQVSVNAGGTAPATFTWVSTTGSHTFQVVIDPDNTLNNTNRANNSSTFMLNVGPSLTINVPLNVTANGGIWIMINGTKYNINSTQFQTSVPSGSITVDIQPAVNVSQGVRQSFTGWSDGSTSNPREIKVTNATVLQAVYATQYLLTVNANGGTTTPSAWYSPNSTVTVEADNPSNVTADASRYLFTSWSGDLTSNSATLTVTMSKPVTLQANWIRQYYLAIISSTGSPSGEGWYNAGTIVTVGVQSTVQYPNGTRMMFNGWNSTDAAATTQVALNAPTKIFAIWQTQYLLTVNSAYGTPIGSGWYNAGASAQASVPNEIDYTNGTRRVFTGWTGDYSGSSSSLTLTVYAPKNLYAQWKTQYLITFGVSGLPNATVLQLNLNNATYGLSAGSSYETWADEGSLINPTLNGTITEGLMSYKFTGWRNATGTVRQDPLTVNGPATYIASYTTQLSLPPVPGFPIEAIILGILLGLLTTAFRRKMLGKKKQSSNRAHADELPSESAFDRQRLSYSRI